LLQLLHNHLIDAVAINMFIVATKMAARGLASEMLFA